MNIIVLKYCTLLFIILGVCILIYYIKMYIVYLRDKGTKVKYFPCLLKSTMRYYWAYIVLIYIIPIIYSLVSNMKFQTEIRGFAYALNMLYYNILYIIIISACLIIIKLLLQVICGNVILINDKFVVIYNSRINFGEVNYVKIFPEKGIIKRRKVEIYSGGKLDTRFLVRDKYTANIINIFKNKDVSLKIKD